MTNKSSHKNKSAIIIAVITALATVIVAIIYQFGSHSNSDKPTTLSIENSPGATQTNTQGKNNTVIVNNDTIKSDTIK